MSLYDDKYDRDDERYERDNEQYDPNDGQEDDNDYFNSSDPEVEEEKKPKPVKLKPEDPRYWDKEDNWAHLKPRRRTRFYLWLILAAVCLGGIITVYLRYFSPYIEEAVQYGYVENIEKRGVVFKTFEGTLIPYKELMDTTRIYHRDFIFTADNVKVATELKRAELSHRPVKVEYKRYFGTLPWRGSSQIIVTKVDSVNPRDILPPEFRPQVVELEPEVDNQPASAQ